MSCQQEACMWQAKNVMFVSVQNRKGSTQTNKHYEKQHPLGNDLIYTNESVILRKKLNIKVLPTNHGNARGKKQKILAEIIRK